MKITNITRGTTICDKAKEAVSLWDRSIGLMDKSNPRCLLFKTRFGIHTFFLTSSIDCLVFDNSMIVKAAKKNLFPNRFWFWSPKYKYILELPVGTIDKSRTQVGDQISLTDQPRKQPE